jgi:hypothetical protein
LTAALSIAFVRRIFNDYCVVSFTDLVALLGLAFPLIWCDNPPRKIPYYRLRPIHFGP